MITQLDFGGPTDPVGASYAQWAAAGLPSLPVPQKIPAARAPSGGLAVYTTLADFEAAVANPGALSSEEFEGGSTAATVQSSRSTRRAKSSSPTVRTP